MFDKVAGGKMGFLIYFCKLLVEFQFRVATKLLVERCLHHLNCRSFPWYTSNMIWYISNLIFLLFDILLFNVWTDLVILGLELSICLRLILTIYVNHNNYELLHFTSHRLHSN